MKHRRLLLVCVCVWLLGCAGEELAAGPLASENVAADAIDTNAGLGDAAISEPVDSNAGTDDADPGNTSEKDAGPAKNADSSGLQDTSATGDAGTTDVSQPTCADAGKNACNQNEACVDGVCKPKVCAVGLTTCAGDSLLTCGAKGTKWLTTDCAGLQPKHKCTVLQGKALCFPLLCDAGATACQGSSVLQCNKAGDAWVPILQCDTKKDGSTCDGGKCTSPKCKPKSLFCDGNSVRYCNSKGDGATVIKTCANTQACWLGACMPTVCTLGQKTCGDAATVKTCVDKGIKWLPTKCGAGTLCKAGQCVGQTCVETVHPGKSGKLDVVVLVSTTYSMQQEIGAVGTFVTKLGQQLMASGLDVRMVLVGQDNAWVKLPADLSSVMPPGKLMTVTKPVTAYGAFYALLKGPPKGLVHDFKAFLRPDAAKHVVVASDNDSLNMPANVFHSDLLAIQHPSSPIGPPLFQGYRFHALVGMGDVPFKGCATAVRNGLQYQTLAGMTKGMTASICTLDGATTAKALYTAMAQSLPVSNPCQYDMPAAIPKDPNKLKSATASYTIGGKIAVPQVDNKAACTGKKGFYFAPSTANPQHIQLCAATCSDINNLPLELSFPCQ